MPFKNQLVALQLAHTLVSVLPKGTGWSLTITDDDDAGSLSAFNIYLKQGESPSDLIKLLNLGTPTDREVKFLSFKHGILLISIIEGEENV